MNTTRSSMLVPVPGYTELQRDMHDAFRTQYPEWIEGDGKSPMCDYYESLFAVLLVSHRADARAHYDHLLSITESQRVIASANCSIPVGHADRPWSPLELSKYEAELAARQRTPPKGGDAALSDERKQFLPLEDWWPAAGDVSLDCTKSFI